MRFTRILSIIVALSFIAGACKMNPQSANLPADKPESTNSGRAVRDELGRVVVLPKRVERAVSLAPNLTEIVFAVGAGDRLVGVTTYCDYPEATAAIAKVGDTLKPNIESIIALKPDVVLVSTASQLETFTKTLNDQRIAVVVTNPNSLEGIYRSIELIGVVFESPKAVTLISEMKERVSRVENLTAAAEKPRVFLQLDRSLYTIGRESYLTDLIARAGGRSATADVDKAYAQLSKESALALDPDVVILSDSTDNKEPADVLSNSKAVRSGRVHKINADILSRPGPRVVDALEQLAAALHPELFKR